MVYMCTIYELADIIIIIIQLGIFADVLGSNQSHYGAVDGLIVKGQTQARKRIVYFLVNFIFTGLVSKSCMS